jgi:chromosomal replication initiation ATPase DnaA
MLRAKVNKSVKPPAAVAQALPPDQALWAAAQDMLKGLLNPNIHRLWFAPLKAVELNGQTLTVEVPNEFSGVWLQDNYQDLLDDVLSSVSGQSFHALFGSPPSRAPGLRKRNPTSPEASTAPNRPPDPWRRLARSWVSTRRTPLIILS